MINRIRDYVDELFTNTPKINRATELHDELLANLVEKYNDLLVQGKSEEEAYRIVIDGIGDMNELLGDLKLQNNKLDYEYMQERRHRYALMIGGAIAIIIGSLMFPIILQSAAGAGLMFLGWATGVGLLIYAGMTKPRYNPKNDTMVEDFKRWSHEKTRRKSLEKSLLDSLGALTVAIYLIVSFATGGWWYTWIIFPISVAVRNAIKAFFDYKGE